MSISSATLEALGIRKTFGPTVALKGVSLQVRRGSIHGLLGGNGSGKSTLIRILAGVDQADAGEIKLGGRTYSATNFSPTLAKTNSVHVVHQHSSTFPHLTVAENLALGRGYELSSFGGILWAEVTKRAERVLKRFAIDASPDELLSNLRPAVQMMIAIARALQDQEGSTEGVLILDEPTATLAAPEVEMLSVALRCYAAAGQSIVIVTHRLQEVISLCDRVTVFRDGEVAGDLEQSEITYDRLVDLISGKWNAENTHHPTQVGETMLEVDNLAVGPLSSINLNLRAGEILGIAGLVGSGRSSLLRSIFGLLPARAGTIRLAGRLHSPKEPRDAMQAGIAYVPEDRILDASFGSLTVCENISIANIWKYWRRFMLQFKGEVSDATELSRSITLKPQRIDIPISYLSGGNQQKVIIGRWLARRPKLLLLDEPSQGVDVGARAEIHQLIRAATKNGSAAIVVSSDFSELVSLCDRVLVLNQGRVAADISREKLSTEYLHELAYVKVAA